MNVYPPWRVTRLKRQMQAPRAPLSATVFLLQGMAALADMKSDATAPGIAGIYPPRGDFDGKRGTMAVAELSEPCALGA